MTNRFVRLEMIAGSDAVEIMKHCRIGIKTGHLVCIAIRAGMRGCNCSRVRIAIGPGVSNVVVDRLGIGIRTGMLAGVICRFGCFFGPVIVFNWVIFHQRKII